MDVGVVALGEAVNELVGTGRLTGRHTLFLGGVGVAPAQVFQDGTGEEGVLLQHHRHLVAQGLHVIAAHVQAAHLYGALGHIVQPTDEVDQAALA